MTRTSATSDLPIVLSNLHLLPCGSARKRARNLYEVPVTASALEQLLARALCLAYVTAAFLPVAPLHIMSYCLDVKGGSTWCAGLVNLCSGKLVLTGGDGDQAAAVKFVEPRRQARLSD
jgi:hypothetical protein